MLLIIATLRHDILSHFTAPTPGKICVYILMQQKYFHDRISIDCIMSIKHRWKLFASVVAVFYNTYPGGMVLLLVILHVFALLSLTTGVFHQTKVTCLIETDLE